MNCEMCGHQLPTRFDPELLGGGGLAGFVGSFDDEPLAGPPPGATAPGSAYDDPLIRSRPAEHQVTSRSGT